LYLAKPMFLILISKVGTGTKHSLKILEKKFKLRNEAND